MQNYGIVEDGVIVNVIVADAKYAEEQGLIDLYDNVGIGWFYSDGVLTAPADTRTDEEIAELERKNRDAMLAETDWSALGDVAMTDEMAAYRQALRDVPAQAGFPRTIEWPTKP